MARMTSCTAAALRAVLCFTNPENTPKIAYDDDSLIEPLIKKVKDAVGDKDGSQSVHISWGDGENELLRQFNGVCNGIQSVFNSLSFCTQEM